MLKQKLKPTQAARHVSALYSQVLGSSALVCNRHVPILLIKVIVKLLSQLFTAECRGKKTKS
jgi:hypothetical protein